MVWHKLAENVRWTTDTPATYVSFYYQMERIGATMRYRTRIEVLPMPVGGASYYGYDIKYDLKINGAQKETGKTVKNNSPAQWDKIIAYNSGWYDIPNKTTGTTSVVYRVYSSNCVTKRDQTYTYSMKIEPAGSTLNSVTSTAGNVEDTITLNSTVLNPSFAHELAVYCQGVFVGMRNDVNTNTYQFNLVQRELENIYFLLRNRSSASFTFTLSVWNGSTLISEDSKTLTLYIRNAAPVFANFTYLDDNSTTKMLTNNANRIVKGYSSLKATVTAASPQKGASITKYSVNGLVDINPPATSMTRAKWNLEEISIIAYDSKKNIKTAGNWVDYAKPVIKKVMAERQGGIGEITTLTIEGEYFHGAFGSGGQTNSLILQYRFRKEGVTTWSSWATLAYTPTSRSFKWAGQINGDKGISGFDKTVAFEIEVKAKDRLDEAFSAYRLSSGTPAIAISGNKVKQINFDPPMADYVIEQGSNNNGYWIKYASGKMEQWGSASSTQSVLNNLTAVFPISFIDSNAFIFTQNTYTSGYANSTIVQFSLHTINRVSATFYCRYSADNVHTIPTEITYCNWFAIGRWK
jgi:hypothetical protein